MSKLQLVAGEGEQSPSIPRRGNLGEDRVLKPMPCERLAIVGMGATIHQYFIEAMGLGGWKRPNSNDQVWVVGSASHIIHADLAWSLHDAEHTKEIQKQYSHYREGWFGNLKMPCVLMEAMEEIPNSMEYPLYEVIEKVNCNYFTNTIPYMLAFASMLPGLRDLHMFGADYDYYGNDYVSENGRHCTEYWLGRLEQQGICIHVPRESKLMDMGYRASSGRGMYGYIKQPIFKRDNDDRIHLSHWDDPLQHLMEDHVTARVMSHFKIHDPIQGKAMVQSLCKLLGEDLITFAGRWIKDGRELNGI